MPGACASDAHWIEIRLLHQLSHAHDSGDDNDLGQRHGPAAAAARLKLFAALRDVGRDVGPDCSICLEALDVEGGKDVDVLQCFHAFHKVGLVRLVYAFSLRRLRRASSLET